MSISISIGLYFFSSDNQIDSICNCFMIIHDRTHHEFNSSPSLWVLTTPENTHSSPLQKISIFFYRIFWLHSSFPLHLWSNSYSIEYEFKSIMVFWAIKSSQLLQKQTHQAMLQMNANKIVVALPHDSDPMMAFQAQPNHHNGRYHCCKNRHPKPCSKWSDAWMQQKSWAYNNLPTKPMVFHTIRIRHGIPSTTKSSQWRISLLHHHTHYEAMCSKWFDAWMQQNSQA